MRAAEARDVLTGKAPPFPDPVARAIAADLAEAAKPPEPVIPRGMETPPNATAETAVALPEPPAPAAPSAGEARPEPAPEPPPSASEAAPAPPLRDYMAEYEANQARIAAEQAPEPHRAEAPTRGRSPAADQHRPQAAVAFTRSSTDIAFSIEGLILPIGTFRIRPV